MNNPCQPTRPIEINPTNIDFLTKLIRQIIRMQNEAVAVECPSCLTSLNNNTNNTKPVVLYLCNGEMFTSIVPPIAEDLTTTYIYRFEELLDDNYVKVRLLQFNGTTIVCTTFTAIIKISCICQVQCLDPIYCELCDSNCN